MREVLVYDPGDKVRYTGKPLKICLPIQGAYIAGRMGSSQFDSAFVEMKFSLLDHRDGVVVPNPEGEENTSFCLVKFPCQPFGDVVVPIEYQDLEPV